MMHMYTNCPDIGVLIKCYRRERGLTQQDLADEINLTRLYIARIENGDTLPGIHCLVILIAALKIPEAELLPHLETAGADKDYEKLKKYGDAGYSLLKKGFRSG